MLCPPSAPPPPSHSSDALSDSTLQKECRICLVETLPETMIAPCCCRGHREWVHRACLDTWRASNATNFNQCEICEFRYQYEEDPEALKARNESESRRIWVYRSRMIQYILVRVMLAHLVIAALGALTYLFDYKNQVIVHGMFGDSLSTAASYTLFAYLLFFFLIGVLGTLVLVCCGASDPAFFPSSEHHLAVDDRPPPIFCVYDDPVVCCRCCSPSSRSRGYYHRNTDIVICCRCGDGCGCDGEDGCIDCGRGCKCEGGRGAEFLLILLAVIFIVIGMYLGFKTFVKLIHAEARQQAALLWRRQLVAKYVVRHFQEPPIQKMEEQRKEREILASAPPLSHSMVEIHDEWEEEDRTDKISTVLYPMHGTSSDPMS